MIFSTYRFPGARESTPYKTTTTYRKKLDAG
jgi:hypothetical protein